MKRTKSILSPVCMTIAAICNFASAILSIPSGLGFFMLATAILCTVAAVLGFCQYRKKSSFQYEEQVK